MTVTPSASDQSLQQQIVAFNKQLATQAPPEALAQFDAEIERVVRSGLAERSLRAGQQAPDFTLPDATGRQVTLSALLERGPVAVVFYRGEWCPYCNLMLRAYQGIQPQIRDLGATMVAISPQTPDNSLTTVEKKGLTFPVLSDRGNAVARRYGLVFAYSEEVRPLLTAFGSALPVFNGDDSWEIPVPGIFVIARDGTIALASVDPDWTKRPEPAAILESLRAQAGR
jgi:peroxiredoxin